MMNENFLDKGQVLYWLDMIEGLLNDKNSEKIAIGYIAEIRKLACNNEFA